VAWLAGWSKRRQIVIDQTNISGGTNFPVYVKVSASSGISAADVSSIFDELGANSLKIAVTEADGITQCYVEVVSWSAVSEFAELHVKVAAPTSYIYLYYDNTHADNSSYVGVVGSTPAKAVWDANYVAVYHMNDNPDTSHIADSTGNANNGTKKGANEPVEATGLVGKTQSFDGNNDYIDCGTSSTLDITGSFTMETWINISSLASSRMIYCKGLGNTDGWYVRVNTVGNINLITNQGGANQQTLSSVGVITINTPYYIAVIRSGTGALTFVDAIDKTSVYGVHINPLTSARHAYIGRDDGGGTLFLGLNDELRISNIARSANWIKSTNQALTDALLTFGGEQISLSGKSSSSSRTDLILNTSISLSGKSSTPAGRANKWVSPTGFNDPDSGWTNEPNAYDGDIGTYAYGYALSHQWTSFLELTIDQIFCSSIRYYYLGAHSEEQDSIDIDVYDIDWHNVYQGSTENAGWNEHSLDILRQVTKLRVRCYNAFRFAAYPRVFEFSFYQIYPSLILNTEISLSGKSLSATRTDVTLKTGLSLSGKSLSETRAVIELDTLILLSGKSYSATRVDISLFARNLIAWGILKVRRIHNLGKIERRHSLGKSQDKYSLGEVRERHNLEGD
jgi:hypothetical protein